MLWQRIHLLHCGRKQITLELLRIIRALSSVVIAKVVVFQLARVISAVSVCVDKSLVLADPLVLVLREAKCPFIGVCRSWLVVRWGLAMFELTTGFSNLMF